MSNSEEVLKNVLLKVAEKLRLKNLDTEIKPISSDGANYSSALYQVTLIQHQKPPIKLFAKIAQFSESIRESSGGKFYETEGFFYEDFYPEMADIEDENNLIREHRLAVPKFYGCDTTYGMESFVLEDLTVEGYRSFERQCPFDLDYALRSVEQMARLHALSIAVRIKSPTFFETTRDRISYPRHLVYSKAFYEDMIRSSLTVVEDELKTKVQSYVDSTDLIQDWIDACKPGNQPVLVHGDFRASNLMHRRKNSELEIILMDFQTMFVGSPIIDLMYFIFNGSDEEFRRLYYKDLLDHYYNELGETLRRLGHDISEVYSRQNYEEDLEKRKMVGLIVALTILSVVCVDTDVAPDLGGELSDFVIKPSKIYKERLNGVIRDYVRWGYL